MPTRFELLKEYKELLLECGNLRAVLAKKEARCEEIERLITADEQPFANHQSIPQEPAPEKPEGQRVGRSIWDRIRGKPVAESIREVARLAKQRGQIGVDDVVAEFGLTQGAATLRLSRAVKAGWLERVARGRYEVDPLHP